VLFCAIKKYLSTLFNALTVDTLMYCYVETVVYRIFINLNCVFTFG
jgi:hypothetical protein